MSKSKVLNSYSSLYNNFELCREKELQQHENRCMRYDKESGKCAFQVAGQFDRPREFLEALIDIIRVIYDPNPLGTLLLNSNPAFILEAIPRFPFSLGYISVLGSSKESFESLWHGKVASELAKNNYDLEKVSTAFIVVAGSSNRNGFELLDDVLRVTQSGFSIDEVLHLFASASNIITDKPKNKDIYAGTVFDEGLDDRLRISLWLFIEAANELPVRRPE
jgi:hypothetical protein